MSKPPLLYGDLEPGRTFEPFVLKITEQFVRQFCEAVGDRNPIYFDKQAAQESGFSKPVAPAAIAGIFGRRSYLERYAMPPGGILVGQEFEFTGPAYVGDELTAIARVERRFEKNGKKFVAIGTEAVNQNGEVVGKVHFTAIWPK